MNKNGNGGSAGIIFLVILLLFVFIGSCGDSESSYERDVRSGFDKWSSGDYNSMTKDEKEAVNNFLEWSNDN